MRNARVFVPGCLVIDGPSYAESKNFINEVAGHPGFAPYELILVVDNVSEATSTEEKFLWTWFTRFEPAADIHAAGVTHNRFHTALKAPIFFDSRMKPWYPGTVEPDPSTVALVDKRWREYFPKP